MTRVPIVALLALALGATGPVVAGAAERAPGSEPLGRPALDTLARLEDPGLPLGTAVAPAPGRPGRSGAYGRPVGPTRDQTSPFGLDVAVTFLSREVEEVIGGERFEFDVDSERYLLKPSVRPVPAIELYGLVGVAALEGDEDIANFNGDSGLALGGGARLTFFRDPAWFDTTLFAEGRYLQFESEARGVAFDTDADGLVDVFADEKFRWKEWEARFGVSWRFYQFRPYAGLRYSDVDADDVVEGGSTVPSVDATDNIGVFLGTDFYFDPSRRAGLTFETSFPDYVSFTVGFRFWF